MFTSTIKAAKERTTNIVRHGAYIPTEYYIFDEKQVVYVSVPKVACTSIKIAIVGKPDNPSDKNDGYMDIHQTSSKYRRFCLQPHQNNYYKFAFVRNPFERLVSCYKDKIQKSVQHNGRYHFATGYNNVLIKSLFGKKFYRQMTFIEFVELAAKIPDWLAEGHFKSQHSMLFGRNKPDINFIGKFEAIDKDWQPIADRFGFDPLIHGNKTKKNDLTLYYSDLKSIELVAKRYRNDIETFSYQEQYENLKQQLQS